MEQRNSSTTRWGTGDRMEESPGKNQHFGVKLRGAEQPSLLSPTLGFHLPQWLPGPLPGLAGSG